VHIVVSAHPLSVERCVDAVKHVGAGAIVLMLGCVRNHTRRTSDGGDSVHVDVAALEYEAYVPMAEQVMRRIATEVMSLDAERRVAIEHRTGALQIGDTAVVVAVSAPHRKSAFDACEDIIDRLKQDAPIWKRETGSDGVVWVGLGP
jgi:molybdopterin synthase catalytic subunit